MSTVTFFFTRRRWNPVSWLIRWALPRSRFAFGLSSHVVIAVGDAFYDSHMLYGVRRSDRATALGGQLIVLERVYNAPDLAAGLEWIERQLCTYRPSLPGLAGAVELALRNNYDWGGALGLLTQGRNWADEDKFWCYELAGAFLRACGRTAFANLNHVGETALLAIEP